MVYLVELMLRITGEKDRSKHPSGFFLLGGNLSWLSWDERHGTSWTDHKSITGLTERQQPFTLTSTANLDPPLVSWSLGPGPRVLSFVFFSYGSISSSLCCFGLVCILFPKSLYIPASLIFPFLA